MNSSLPPSSDSSLSQIPRRLRRAKETGDHAAWTAAIEDYCAALKVDPGALPVLARELIHDAVDRRDHDLLLRTLQSIEGLGPDDCLGDRCARAGWVEGYKAFRDHFDELDYVPSLSLFGAFRVRDPGALEPFDEDHLTAQEVGNFFREVRRHRMSLADARLFLRQAGLL